MITIDDITTGLITLIRIGAVARFIFCMVKLIGLEEQAGTYKRRAKNVILFWILAESIWAIKDITLYYYAM